MSVRTYRMTIASTWYDQVAERVREYEIHFKAARAGDIAAVRRHLADRGVPYFQQRVYRLFGRWIPRRKIRIASEREETTLAAKSDPLIQIQFVRMEGRGRVWKGFRLPSRVLNYVKKKRKRKST